jgi:hypothetical protein
MRLRKRFRVNGDDRVSREYPHRFDFKGGKIVQVVFDVADESYEEVETRLAALMARD